MKNRNIFLYLKHSVPILFWHLHKKKQFHRIFPVFSILSHIAEQFIKSEQHSTPTRRSMWLIASESVLKRSPFLLHTRVKKFTYCYKTEINDMSRHAEHTIYVKFVMTRVIDDNHVVLSTPSLFSIWFCCNFIIYLQCD